MPARLRNLVPSPAAALAGLAAQVLVLALFFLFVLENRLFSNAFISTPVWEFLLRATGGQFFSTPQGEVGAAWFPGILLPTMIGCLLANTWIAWRRARESGSLWSSWLTGCVTNLRWVLPELAWLALWFVQLLWPADLLLGVLVLTPSLALAMTLAGALWSGLSPTWTPTNRPQSRAAYTAPHRGRFPLLVAAGIVAYTVIFTALNWGLWFNLLIPHGDSSMYEEHLWNVLHGKGFRSYLDQGLFLGEHIQVVHLLLLPAYMLWPSHLLLELLQSLIIALTAVPVYRLALRHGGSSRAAACLALATLLYIPLQYLDIAIDFKTFRPNAFGVPTLLCAIDALERRRWGWMSFWFALTLSSQEDFAIVIALLGAWLIVEGWLNGRPAGDGTPAPRVVDRVQLVVGGTVFVGGVAYLIAAVKFVIPWFRDGETVHYVRYFEKFGTTAPEVVWTMLTRPDLVAAEFLHLSSLGYLLLMLIPIGIPLALLPRESQDGETLPAESFRDALRGIWNRWGRLATGLPLYLLLCLNQIAQSTPGPFHHFHAPLIPIVLWAACAALGSPPLKLGVNPARAERLALWMLCCAITTQLFYTAAPTGISFWDPGDRMYWRRLYVPDDRATAFASVAPLIPPTARVASTDFVHPRFTHCERSYDYSNYPRRVSNYLPQVPDDTDYIVLDTAHPYSEIHRPEEVRELREHPEQWEIVPANTQGYYIVLKRRAPVQESSAAN